MKHARTFGLLLAANLALAGLLVAGLHRHAPLNGESASAEAAGTAPINLDSTNSPRLSNSIASLKQPEQPAKTSTNEQTAFTKVYSSDPKAFAENLRRIHCPEETIKDIMTAEVHRRFHDEEQALRPTPADHVPFAWSAKTSEPRLLERRQKAAGLAREESTLLRGALSCELTVPLPLYAMTLSDQQFDAALATSINACAIRDIQDAYWAQVQALQERTKGFWLPQDVADLEALKAQRRQALNALPAPPQ